MQVASERVSGVLDIIHVVVRGAKRALVGVEPLACSEAASLSLFGTGGTVSSGGLALSAGVSCSALAPGGDAAGPLCAVQGSWCAARANAWARARRLGSG